MKTSKPHFFERLMRQPKGVVIVALALVFAGLGFVLAGCVPVAVHPFYKAKDLVYDPALLGVWKDKSDARQYWTFKPGEGKAYTLEIRSEDTQAVFVAHLFLMGSERFLDIYPAQSGIESHPRDNAYDLSLVPAHAVVRVRATDPALRMSSMGIEWLTRYLKQHPKVIDHVLLPDGRVVFTDETKDLQAFVKRHLKGVDAWNDMYDTGLVRASR